MSRCTVLALLGWMLVAPGCSTPERGAAPLQRYEFTRPQMGVPFRIVLHAPDRARGDRAAAAAFTRLAELNSVLSDYDSDTALSRPSRQSGTGQSVPISRDLWRVLAPAQVLARQTEG